MSKLKHMPMWQKILIALTLGVGAGLLFGDYAKMLKPLGDIFMSLIRMTVQPVIFVSLVCGILSLHDLSKMGRIAAKTLLVFALTMAFAAALGMGLATLFGIGTGLNHLIAGAPPVAGKSVSFTETIVSIFPSNVFYSLANGDVLPVIVFSIFFGLSINLAGEAGEPVARFFTSLNEVVFKLILLVLSFAPIGVFALMAYVTADNGFAVLGELASLVGTIYLACLIMLFGVYSLILRVAGLNPLRFIRKMLPVQLFAYSTGSSSATIPLNIETAEHQLGVKNSIASFVLPLGATVNMNGLSTYLGAVAIFAANAYGVHLSISQMVMVILTTTLAAIGAAGVPGTALIVMSLVLSSVGLPLEIIAVIAAVDRIIDMMNTATNVSGDTLAAVIVARSEGDLDRNTYNAEATE
ncbi:dicarboxylate/amino acid:cation symporter [Jeongeupia naejangsanensis]|uniref:Dicarboxylate/amino acid:cation symporter n=1 Tax=Jeongeupia naejangsanensis TaxID=613195 RepID=A0ABS2BMV0_9NEIS|nr:dicarboxylate/amino acid:cation symporter [Jeongeupia naejangsanensis]MBM3116928.1 dicarboxylate/amino acid:cation symporter [Jeongeupia naejangsanensis]